MAMWQRKYGIKLNFSITLTNEDCDFASSNPHVEGEKKVLTYLINDIWTTQKLQFLMWSDAYTTEIFFINIYIYIYIYDQYRC